MFVRSLHRAGVPALWVVTALILAHCDARTKTKPSRPDASARPTAAAAQTKPAFVSRPRNGAPIDAVVREEVARGQQDHVRVLVYVGASWCEPCQRFHESVESGELDAVLPNLRFVEFDRDRDGPELDRAGYGSRLIPLLAIPDASGRGTQLRIEGSIKGPTAVHENLVPRLLQMLDPQEPRP